MSLRVDVITLFPEIFSSIKAGLVGQALEKSLWQLHLWQLRDFTQDLHRSVDDRPYGGGDGMVLMAQPLLAAVEAVTQAQSQQQKFAQTKAPVILLSAHGQPISTGLCVELARLSQITLVCGRYSGVDQRFINDCVDLEVSVGDAILTGGEIPAMALIDATVRLLPGVLGHPASARCESFFSGLLEAPQFTRPQTICGQAVPAELLSGDPRRIENFLAQVAILITEQKRPDLAASLSPQAKKKAHEFLQTLAESDRQALGLGPQNSTEARHE